jgi:hypothetical protein
VTFSHFLNVSSFFWSLNVMRSTVVGCHWGPVILTSARIGSLGPGRFTYSRWGWALLRPSDSAFSQNWKPGTGETPLLSLWLGATEAQWFWLRPELEAWEWGDSPTLTVDGCLWKIYEAQWFWIRPELEAWEWGDSPTLTVDGCLWGPVILNSARIRTQGMGRFPHSLFSNNNDP